MKRQFSLFSPAKGLGALVLGCALIMLPAAAQAGDPEWNALESILVPGLGQVIQGDTGAGMTQFVLTTVLAKQYFISSENPSYIPFLKRDSPSTHGILTNHATMEADMYASLANGMNFYSAYAAYLGGRAKINNAGYSTPLAKDTFGEVVTAPFRWKHISRWTTWVPLLLPLAELSAPIGPNDYIYTPTDATTREELRSHLFAEHVGVAVGEESLFRGLFNTMLSEWWGPGWGLFGSSALFGVAHGGAVGQATATSAFFMGYYLGYLQQQNDYSIAQGVALHFWWNAIVSYNLSRQRGFKGSVNLVSFATRF